MKMEIELPDKLRPITKKLVIDFAQALAEKLRSAEIKYGYTGLWSDAGIWDNEECREKLMEHISKGDPRDVAAYCAFMWYHGWTTSAAITK